MKERRILAIIEPKKPRRDSRTHVHRKNRIIHLIGEKKSNLTQIANLLSHETIHIVLDKLFPKGGPSSSLNNISFWRKKSIVFSYCYEPKKEAKNKWMKQN